MALVALLSSFVSLVLYLEYSYLYISGNEIRSKSMNANFILYSCYTDYTASLSGRCIGTGRVVSGSLSVVSRLLGIIIWGYILRIRGGPLMVIAC